MNVASESIKPKYILFCKCGGERISTDILNAVEEHLVNLPVSVISLSDLCGLVAQKRELSKDLFKAGAEYLVVGCYRRTMDLLFNMIEDGEKTPDYNHVNLIESSPDQAFEQMNAFCNGQNVTPAQKEIREDSGWPSWYPLIDYTRCIACGQCADFCLFGVYEKAEGQVKVTNPQGCKNNCPACARICQATAIIFPKYKHGGAVGGSDEIDEYAEQKRQTKDIENFLGADIYSALEKRKVTRQSIIRVEAMKQALSDRDDALKGIN